MCIIYYIKKGEDIMEKEFIQKLEEISFSQINDIQLNKRDKTVVISYGENDNFVIKYQTNQELEKIVKEWQDYLNVAEKEVKEECQKEKKAYNKMAGLTAFISIIFVILSFFWISESFSIPASMFIAGISIFFTEGFGCMMANKISAYTVQHDPIIIEFIKQRKNIKRYPKKCKFGIQN